MDPSALLSRDAGLFAAERIVLWIACAAYGVALLFYIAHIIRPSWKVSRTGSTISLLSAAGLQTIVIILRVVLKGAPPFQSLYESLAWFAWMTVVAYLIIEWRRNVRIPGFFVSLIAGGAVLYALLGQNPEIKPLFPALQSAWFFWHVAIAFGSYAIFVVAFAVEISYLIQLLLWKLGAKVDYGLTRENIGRFHLPDADVRHHVGRGVGQRGVGRLLAVGPEGDVVAHHVVRLCAVSAYAGSPHVARRAVDHHRNRRVPVHGHDVHWSELAGESVRHSESAPLLGLIWKNIES
ncbi:MAG: cytochrome c biogenesis protein CcsA [Deltaproteobacteria bacterium]|nr:cytochrome c biogenesis protein CcsA [Deltaproteobacteria bacterium]